MSFIHTFEIKENSTERNHQQNSIHIVDTQELFAVKIVLKHIWLLLNKMISFTNNKIKRQSLETLKLKNRIKFMWSEQIFTSTSDHDYIYSFKIYLIEQLLGTQHWMLRAIQLLGKVRYWVSFVMVKWQSLNFPIYKMEITCLHKVVIKITWHNT